MLFRSVEMRLISGPTIGGDAAALARDIRRTLDIYSNGPHYSCAIDIGVLAFLLSRTPVAVPPADPAAPEIRRHPKNPSQVIEPALPPGTLAVWHNGWDWVVASSREDARDVACASSGERPEDYDADDWERCADDSTVTIRGDNGAPSETRTCAEWVTTHGRGFLCTTEA